MDQKILKQLKQIINDALANVAKKSDLKRELSSYPTKEDLKQELARYATKDDLKKELSGYLTKKDLKMELVKFATRDDLKTMEENLKKEIHESEMRVVELVDKHKADKTQVNDIQRRVTGIEGQLQNL